MSYDENPADNDPHGECRSEIHQLQNLLGQVCDQCGNHRAADRRHCLSQGLRDEIQKYLKATGYQCAITQQENKGDDMTEMSDDDKNREAFLSIGFLCNETYSTDAIKWGQNRVKQLEFENKNLSKTVLTLSKSPLLKSSESDEEIHQRRRQERMLDEITLICMRGGIGAINLEEDRAWVRICRDTAENLCREMNEYDAE